MPQCLRDFKLLLKNFRKVTWNPKKLVWVFLDVSPFSWDRVFSDIFRFHAVVFRGCNHILNPIIEVCRWLFEGQNQLTLVHKENHVISFIKSVLNMFQTVILNMDKHCTWATYFWWTESCQHQLKHLNILWVTVLQSLQIGQIFCRWRRLFDPASLGSHIKVLIQVADSCSSQRRWLPFLWASQHPGEKGNRRELTGLHLVEIDATQPLETHAAWYPPWFQGSQF